jgi:hypothetical protein
MQEGYSAHSGTFLTLEPLIYDIDESAYLFENVCLSFPLLIIVQQSVALSVCV